MSYRINFDSTITRLADDVTFPQDDRDADWQRYYTWLAAGGTPEIEPVPEPVPEPEPGQQA